MNYIVLLDSRADTEKAELEEKYKFIRSILERLGIDIDFWPQDNASLNVEEQIQLRRLCDMFELKIMEQGDGSIEILHQINKIASWEKPQYILKRDITKLGPFDQLYLEMKVTFSSVFEDD